MKAVRIHQVGGPDVLSYDDVPTPTPGAGQVLIKVGAVGMNFADLMMRQGVYPVQGGFPATLGFEVAGVVSALGDGVAEPAIGTRVITIGGAGGYAEYTVAPAAFVFPIPDSLSFSQATALFLQGLTAYGLLHEAGQLQPGETVLIHAAAGGVGLLTVQLAKLMGAGKVIGTASADTKLEVVRRLGADAAINYTHADWVEQVKTATDGNGAHLILDSVGGDIGTQSFQVLHPGGRFVTYGSASGQPTPITIQQLTYAGHRVIGYSMGTQTPPEQIATWGRVLLDYAVQGKLEAVIGQTFPLEQAAAAHQAMAERQTTGKVVLLP